MQNRADYRRMYSANSQLNTHRVVAMEEVDGKLQFTTKGDANEIADLEVVYEKDILGKVIASSLLLGKIIRLLLNPFGFVVVIIIPLFIMVVMNIRSAIYAAKELSKEELEEIEETIQKMKELKETKEINEAEHD